MSLKHPHCSYWNFPRGAGDDASLLLPNQLPIGTEQGGRSILTSLGLVGALTLWLGNVPVMAQHHLVPAFPLAQTSTTAQATEQTTQLIVNPVAGNDASGNGSSQAPFKTITQALQAAQPNTVILLAPGTYSAETGESFPIELKPGVTIQGDPTTKGRNIVIQGGGFFLSRTFARQNIAILGANQSGLAGVTVTNPNRRGYGLWIESTSPVVVDNTFTGNTHDGISVTGSGAPLIRNNYFVNNGANGITIFNSARPEVQENVFQRTGFGITIAQTAAPTLVANRITQNKDGIVVQGRAQPILRGNAIEANERDGLVAIQQSRPDVGTSGQPGGNVFRNNRRYDINTIAATGIIPAFGNQLARNRVAGRLDWAGTVYLGTTGEVQGSREAGEISRVQLPSSPLPVTNNQEAIAIPVTPPPQASTPRQQTTRSNRRASASRRRNRQTLPPPSIPQTDAIQTSVPTPESGAALQPSTATAIPNRSTLPNLGVQPGVLPVPGQQIPVGNTGNFPPVEVPRNSPRQVETGLPQRYNPLPPSSRAAALGFRYRVVVDVENARQLRRVRSLVPGAFRTRSNGRTMMQVGAYADRVEAEDMLQKMTSNGLNATIEEL